MSTLSKLEFTALDISHNNYLPWTLDAKIHLTTKNLGETINHDNQASLQDKAKAMIFLRHNLHEDLKREYLVVEDPLELWHNIKDRFDHQKLVLHPKSRSEWIHLRLQDYKTVSEYNSALFRITSELKLCGDTITDDDMLDKTFSTFHASQMLLASHYRESRFTKYFELISCLLVAKQNNKLLLQNYQARHGVSPFPEANVATYHSGRGRGRRGGSSRGRGRWRGRSNTWHRESQKSKSSIGESSRQNTRQPSTGKAIGTQSNICYRCGMTNQWSHTYHTPKHLVEAYQHMMKGKEKNVETNLIGDASNFSSPGRLYITHLDACDFIENVRADNVI